MESNKINNLDEWVSIVLSERIRKDGKYECLIDGLFDPKSNEFVLLEIINNLINDDNCYKEFKNYLEEKIIVNKNRIINKDTICEECLINVLKSFDNDIFYEEWLNTICDGFSSSSFELINNFIDYSYKKIPEKFWINKVNDNVKRRFVESVIREATYHNTNFSCSARELLENFNSESQQLIKYLFLLCLKTYHHLTFLNFIISEKR